jgi:hypothetical protein
MIGERPAVLASFLFLTSLGCHELRPNPVDPARAGSGGASASGGSGGATSGTGGSSAQGGAGGSGAAGNSGGAGSGG